MAPAMRSHGTDNSHAHVDTEAGPRLILTRDTRITLMAIVLLAAIGLFAYFVWPTLWSYSSTDNQFYRTNRITGLTQVKSGDTWRDN